MEDVEVLLIASNLPNRVLDRLERNELLRCGDRSARPFPCRRPLCQALLLGY